MVRLGGDGQIALHLLAHAPEQPVVEATNRYAFLGYHWIRASLRAATKKAAAPATHSITRHTLHYTACTALNRTLPYPHTLAPCTGLRWFALQFWFVLAPHVRYRILVARGCGLPPPPSRTTPHTLSCAAHHTRSSLFAFLHGAQTLVAPLAYAASFFIAPGDVASATLPCPRVQTHVQRRTASAYARLPYAPLTTIMVKAAYTLRAAACDVILHGPTRRWIKLKQPVAHTTHQAA